MNDCVLFSPVSDNDPSRYDHEGAFLRILREYQPQKAYVFFTKEMLKFHKKDDRYFEMGKWVCPNCEFIPIESDIDDAHHFDAYDKHFEDKLKEIYNENPDKEILVNITSGTPQMKAYLYILAATLPFELVLVQVSTPKKKSNNSQEEYNIEAQRTVLEKKIVENIFDNRLEEITPDNVIRKIIDRKVISHIENYDYNTALALVTTEYYSNELQLLLEAAKCRASLDIKGCKEILKKTSVTEKDFFPVLTGDEIIIFEYILYLSRKLKKDEFADFARGISPVLTDLFEKYLSKIFKVYVNTWLIKNDGYLRRFSKDIMSKDDIAKEVVEYLDKIYEKSNGFRDKEPVAASNLMLIINYFSIKQNYQNQNQIKMLRELREFEENVRNIAAHRIVGLTKEQINSLAGCSIEKILDKIKFIYKSIFKLKDNEYWNSYANMNKLLIEKLNAQQNSGQN